MPDCYDNVHGSHWCICSCLLQSATARFNQLRLTRTLHQWRTTAQQLGKLRAKAQLVLKRMLQRRMRAGLDAWKAAADYQVAKRAMMVTAMQYWRRLCLVKALVSWAAFVEVSSDETAIGSSRLVGVSAV